MKHYSLLLQLSEGKLNHYLNVYSEFDTGGELDLNKIARELTVQLTVLTAKLTFCCVVLKVKKAENSGS